MFSEIIKAIEAKEYDLAVHSLQAMCKNENYKTASQAAYLLGYIYTQRDYKQHNERTARMYLRRNMDSDFASANAYILYSGVEDDINTAFNYLNQGVRRFPRDPRLLRRYFCLAPQKEVALESIEDSKLTEPYLLGEVLSYLIAERQWDRVQKYIFRITKNNDLDDETQIYLDLFLAYSYVFEKQPHYKDALKIFETIIQNDVNNLCAYAHYLGSIYVLLKLNEMTKATELFDRIPLNNTLHDFNDGPEPLDIYIDLDFVYKAIFNEIFSAFAKDRKRKLASQVLYSLYLYYPSEMFDVCRYKKADAAILTRYLKSEFNSQVAAALFEMRCHFKQYREAYDILWIFLKEECEDFDKIYISFAEIVEGAQQDDIYDIADMTVRYMSEYEYCMSCFVKEVFGELVENLHLHGQYSRIQAIAQRLSDKDILDSTCAFECAYAFEECEDNRAERIYEEIIRRNPDSPSAINNLGVIYERKRKLEQSLECYEKAYEFAPESKIYQNNLQRIKEYIDTQNRRKIEEISDSITVDALHEIGYTNELIRRLENISDTAMREILSRDLFECALAIVSGQDKMATIMCGSISEALIMQKITGKQIEKYDISEISRHQQAEKYPIRNMGLNELLYVADQLKILDKNAYHLGHYIRDYRNVVHPAKEIRMKEQITHDNVLIMWSVLKRLIGDLYPIEKKISRMGEYL